MQINVPMDAPAGTKPPGYCEMIRIINYFLIGIYQY